MSRRTWKGQSVAAVERETSPHSHSPTLSRSHAFTLSRPHALTLFAIVVLALSAWQANRQVCPGCSLSDVSLALPDGTPIYGRLYLPTTTAATAAPLPAVVVCHGYLANLAFMEMPWAADLTRLGLAVLFLDRRGYGRSGGTLWPRAAVSQNWTILNRTSAQRRTSPRPTAADRPKSHRAARA